MVSDGRWTARLPERGAVVFLLGMRFNKPWRVDRWWPAVRALPRMIAHLGKHPELGFLGGHSWFGRTTVLVSYWRSADDLVDFVSARSGPHLAAWQAYDRAVGADGTVGSWHETYLLRPGQFESVCADMPAFGLAAAYRHERLADAGPA
ncbi:DUF4188 domain-containing protein [Kutzneria sp. CA-103260]|uniref:DUF4188 domain-containing protein n=1 Tax=Kutzneria sp. CA-103260 TaxID=2802641 RepID=UPI001BA9C657|nr:DUF4188 domain-containing protein [Kutzneria sp. CA-103260]QUQ70847.1 hypothetical protein JJ691_86300 [Kutzneria sp. CA-103260]